MRFAYADPPYPGCAHRYDCPEVDHKALIERLCRFYPDGWALSTSAAALQAMLAMCPLGVRTMPWVKPFASFKPGVNPGYCWEPVIIHGGRKHERTDPTVRDWHSANITLQKGLIGAKPASFCYWLLDVLNVQPGDELHDLYPGTGIMGRCAEEYMQRRAIVQMPLTGLVPTEEKGEGR